MKYEFKKYFNVNLNLQMSKGKVSHDFRVKIYINCLQKIMQFNFDFITLEGILSDLYIYIESARVTIEHSILEHIRE